MQEPLTIGQRLAEVRERERLGVVAFAEKLTLAGYEISGGSVSKYERSGRGGSDKIDAACLAVVCETFDVSPWWLLLGVGRPEDPPPDTDAFARGVEYAAKRMDDSVRRLRRALRRTEGEDQGQPRPRRRPQTPPSGGMPTGPTG